MLEHHLRQYYQCWFADPFARQLSRRFTPIQLTAIAGVTGLLTVPALVAGWVNAAIALLWLSGVADTLDGTVARLQGKSTPFGTVMDIVTDRLVEFALIIGLFLQSPTERGLLCLCMLGSVLLCVSSFLVVGIFIPNQSVKGFYYSTGFIERAEAFILFSLMIIFPHYFSLLAFIFVLLVLLTTIIRLAEFRQASVLINK